MQKFIGYFSVIYSIIYFTYFVFLWFRIKKVISHGQIVQGIIIKYRRPYPVFMPLDRLYPFVKLKKGKKLMASLPISSTEHPVGKNNSWIWFEKYPQLLVHKETQMQLQIPIYRTVCHALLLFEGLMLLAVA